MTTSQATPTTPSRFSYLRLQLMRFLLSSLLTTPLLAQVNLVPNPSFDDIIDCDFNFGDADFATPWKIIEEETATPDLYHRCSISPFYQVPIPYSNLLLEPKSGDGMVGMVNVLSFAEERIYARLLDDLPTGIDIYVSFSTIPSEQPDSSLMSELCYANAQSMAFSDIQMQSRVIVLESDTILDNTSGWTTLRGCYRASGTEKLVLLGNYKPASQLLMDCSVINNFNFAYHYVDDIIVAPFDVVPDTLIICDDEVLELDVRFYDLSIRWSDGWMGGKRTIDEGGRYRVLAEAGDCFLMDETVVIKIEDQPATLSVELCEGEETLLETPFLARWEDGSIAPSRSVSRSGSYLATLLSPCGERSIEFLVGGANCDIRYYVPNIFSPNFDGINDEVVFNFQSDFDFSGELNIFDRWGNQLFSTPHSSTDLPLRWDGTARGKPLEEGVFVWSYQYTSQKGSSVKVLSGDISLIR